MSLSFNVFLSNPEACVLSFFLICEKYGCLYYTLLGDLNNGSVLSSTDQDIAYLTNKLI